MDRRRIMMEKISIQAKNQKKRADYGMESMTPRGRYS